MLSLLPLLALTTTLTTCTPLLPRAGGPAIVPIPSTCTLDPVTPIDPSTNGSFAANAACNTTFVPTNATLSSAKLYSWFLDPRGRNATADYTTCLEQCYGFGAGVACGGVYFAQSYPSDPQYGLPGGIPSNACIMFKRKLVGADLEVVVGPEVGAVGTNIDC